jgi:hypothetical protein
MRGDNERRGPSGRQDIWLEQRVQLARGQWRREEQAGAVRSVGWWESVTVTWSPMPAPERRSPLLYRALAVAAEAITPPLADLAAGATAGLAAGAARRLLGRNYRPPAALPSSRRQLPPAARALPRPGQAAD